MQINTDCTTETGGHQAYVELNTGMRFCRIPKGDFQMGSRYANEAEHHPIWYADEKPIHNVKIKQSLMVAETQVTVAQFRNFIDDTGYLTSAEHAKESFGLYCEEDGKASWTVGQGLSWNNTGYLLNDDFPVSHVSWEDAMAFCAWLTEIHDNECSFDLLTEEQWEYCASCAGQFIYSWGNGFPEGRRGANIADQSFILKYPNWKYPVLNDYNDGFPLVAPVRQYEPNSFGLYDMTGNVWEWVVGKYTPYPNAPEDALKACQENISRITQNGILGTVDDLRVHRGGGFDWELPFLRVAKRRIHLKNHSAIHIGFRIIRQGGEKL